MNATPAVMRYWRLEEAAKNPPPHFRSMVRYRRERFQRRARERMRELWAKMSPEERRIVKPRVARPKRPLVVGFNTDARMPAPPNFGTRLGAGFGWLNG